MNRRIRILIADDSAFARKVVREVLEGDQIEVVGTARDGEEALDLTASLAPDLVISDLVMPRLNGVEFVRRQMAARPLPILILSSAPQEAPEVIEALNHGALDVVKKPSALATDDLRDVRAELLRKVEEALRVPPATLRPAEPTAPAPLVHAPGRWPTSKVDVVVLGISTGGPQALRRMMPLFPADFPVPFVIVLHMPVGYTALYAEKLNETCALDVHEVTDGEVLRPGVVWVAQAGRHLTFHKSGDRITARLSVHPLEKLHRPSVDVLFRSAAETFGSRVLAVVMTGMGDDGKEGSAWIKAQGGTVITESENSCVIYGMPRSVTEAGLSDVSVPLERMALTIMSHL